MAKRLILTAALASIAFSSAFAQTTPAPSQTPSATPAPATRSDMSKTFIQSQSNTQWLASKLIGLRVESANKENVGSISDLVLNQDGSIAAVVIGVGGFLGIGSKDVAVPLSALNLTRSADGNRATIQLTKAELEKAPDFKPLEEPRKKDTTPVAPATRPAPSQ